MMMALLRRETRPQHEHIERNARMQRLFASDLSLEEYAALIQDQAVFYEAIETALAERPEWADVDFDFAERRKTPMLARDLDVLAARVPDVADADPAGEPRVPDVPDFSAAVGCLYVLEGATLGGQIIARRLREHLGLTPDDGLAFYSAYGDENGRMWRRFRRAVETWTAEGRLDPDAVVAGARATFADLDAWLAAPRARVSPQPA